MAKSATYKIAVSPLVIGITMVGCSTTQTGMFRSAPTSPQEARAERLASTNYDLAQQALQKGEIARALELTEKAVEQSPRDAGYRMLLGDLYLKNGRFLSAETAFSDVLTLHPNSSRARFSLALAQIALGKQYAALIQLDRLAETAAPADLGLAYALAGQPDRAVAMLEPAARAADADGRVRQNLALAYALAGDWQRARVTAAQDLSPADVPARMEQWASFVQPQASFSQVASLLGVTPVQDTGQPARLALAPEAPEPVAVAEAEVVAPVEPLPQAQPVQRVEDAYAVAVEPVKYAEVARTSMTPAPAARADVAPAPAPLHTFKVPSKPKPEPVAGTGRYVVQLAAYKSAQAAAEAWPQVSRRYGLGAHSPVRAVAKLPNGTFHRLSVGGFASQSEATRACQSIKARGGTCFVRQAAGDAPIRFASL
ncbi:MAG TPA: SPOR domain-containing protein [Allosphingosinicella sp.]|nr:SPOR domain-containing protein [Allosphingosinicella sp.]